MSRRKRRLDAYATGAISIKEQRSTLCDKLSFTAAESYKQLRTNLLFALPDENKCRIIGVTSSIRGEGKSTNAINLAYTLAETGKRVLLIDADMRLPSVAKKLALPTRPGLSNLLAGLCAVESAVHPSGMLDNWGVMPAGDLPPNPSELLGSDQMNNVLQRLAGIFDFIVVDLPPVDIVSDAMAVSQWVSGIVVVVRAHYTDRRSLGECMRQLGVLHSKVLGFVVSDLDEHRKEYGRYGKKYYKKSYGYGYGYGKRSDGKKPASSSSGTARPTAAGTSSEKPLYPDGYPLSGKSRSGDPAGDDK